jgi:hypothetical protein
VKILSVWGPWAQLLVLGIKDVENRGWSTSYRGPLAIHASKGGHSRSEVADLLDVLLDDGMITQAQSSLIAARVDSDRGKVIGVVQLVGWANRSDSAWWVPGQIALAVAHPKIITPIPHRGEQGLRDYVLPPSAAAEIQAEPRAKRKVATCPTIDGLADMLVVCTGPGVDRAAVASMARGSTLVFEHGEVERTDAGVWILWGFES